MSYGDPCVTDAELDAFYGKELTPLAIETAETAVLSDMDLLGDYIASASSEREPSAFFGMISTLELVQLAFGMNAPHEQRAEAAIEFRRRYLKYHDKRVLRLASEAML